MTRRIIRLILHYIVGVIFALILGKAVSYICFAPQRLFGVLLFYVPTVYYLIFFLAWPLGPPFAMYCLDKLMFKIAKPSVWRILMGFLLGQSPVILTRYINKLFEINILGWLPSYKGINIDFYLAPFLVTFFTLIGYHSVGLFKNAFLKTNELQTDKTIIELPKRKWQVIRTQKFALIVLLSLIVIIFLLIVCTPVEWKE